jgi:uncharacterized lipoprotein NlpE involved in copper resistance
VVGLAVVVGLGVVAAAADEVGFWTRTAASEALTAADDELEWPTTTTEELELAGLGMTTTDELDFAAATELEEELSETTTLVTGAAVDAGAATTEEA